MPRIPHKIIDGVEHKRCKECEIFKTLSSFYKAGKWHEGKCKKCKNEKAKKNYVTVKEHKNMIQRIKYQKNKDDPKFMKQQRDKSRKIYRRLREDSSWVMKFNKKRRKYFSVERNRKRRNEAQNANRKKKMKDFMCRENYNRKRRESLDDKFRSRMRNALAGRLKYGKTRELIGCSTAQVKVHLERLFKEHMTWENRGMRGWHLDHRVPVKAFDLSNPLHQRVCFWYKNLQPLWAKDNIRKKDKYKEEDKQQLIKDWIFFHI